MSKKTILKCLSVGLAAFALLFIVWLIYGFYTMDATFREEQTYFGDLKGIEGNFRAYFHGKAEYPAYSLEQMKDQGIVDKETYKLIKCYNGKYTPFSSTTPENAVVLEFDYFLFEPDIYTKRDLTTDNNAPDHFVEMN